MFSNIFWLIFFNTINSIISKNIPILKKIINTTKSDFDKAWIVLWGSYKDLKKPEIICAAYQKKWRTQLFCVDERLTTEQLNTILEANYILNTKYGKEFDFIKEKHLNPKNFLLEK